MKKNTSQSYSAIQLFWLTALRVLIGWHFLYEGLVKLVNPNWSSVGYLVDSRGFMQQFFEWLAARPGTLQVVDFANIWGLILIGAGLLLGFLTKPALWAATVMLGFYYLSHPPFVGLNYNLPTEGSYLIVNKVLIELVAVVVLMVFPASRRIGLDTLIHKSK